MKSKQGMWHVIYKGRSVEVMRFKKWISVHSVHGCVSLPIATLRRILLAINKDDGGRDD